MFPVSTNLQGKEKVVDMLCYGFSGGSDGNLIGQEPRRQQWGFLGAWARKRGMQGGRQGDRNIWGGSKCSAGFWRWWVITTRKGFSWLIWQLGRGEDWSYLYSGSDHIHGIGEDGSSGCSQRPRDGLKDNVRALLWAEGRELLWNRGKDSASRCEVPAHVPHAASTSWPNDDKISILSHLRPCNFHPVFSFLYVHQNQQKFINLRPLPEVNLNRTKIPLEKGISKSLCLLTPFICWTEILPDIKLLCRYSTSPNSQAKKAHATYFLICALDNW